MKFEGDLITLLMEIQIQLKNFLQSFYLQHNPEVIIASWGKFLNKVIQLGGEWLIF
jgi:hypothetical protein